MAKSSFPIRFLDPKTGLYYVIFDLDLHESINQIATEVLKGQIINSRIDEKSQSMLYHYNIDNQFLILSTIKSLETSISSPNPDLLGAVEDALDIQD